MALLVSCVIILGWTKVFEGCSSRLFIGNVVVWIITVLHILLFVWNLNTRLVLTIKWLVLQRLSGHMSSFWFWERRDVGGQAIIFSYCGLFCHANFFVRRVNDRSILWGVFSDNRQVFLSISSWFLFREMRPSYCKFKSWGQNLKETFLLTDEYWRMQ